MRKTGYADTSVKLCPLLLSSYTLIWDQYLPNHRFFDLANAIYIGAIPPEKKIFVIGREAEIMTQDQWDNPFILADALVRAQKSPRALMIPQYPENSKIEP